MITQRETITRTFRDGLQQHGRLHASSLTHHDHLCQGYGVLENQSVIDQLDHLTTTSLATVSHVRPDIVKQRLELLKKLNLSAHHNAQLTTLCCLPSTRHRGIGKSHPILSQTCRDRARRVHSSSTQVHDNRRTTRTTDEALLVETCLFDLRSSWQRQEYDICGCGYLGQAACPGCPGISQLFKGCRLHVECNDIALMLERHVATHGASHHTQ